METCARSKERPQSLLLCRYWVRSEFCFWHKADMLSTAQNVAS